MGFLNLLNDGFKFMMGLKLKSIIFNHRNHKIGNSNRT